jgi:signal transduction histidine kinase
MILQKIVSLRLIKSKLSITVNKAFVMSYSKNVAQNLFLAVCAVLVCVSTALSQNNKALQASQLNIDAYQQIKKGDYEKAYRISKRAMLLAKQESNPVEQSRALSNLASSLSYLGDNEKALDLYSQSLDLSKVENDLFGINRALNNIASIYEELEDRNEVLKYRNLQLENSLLSKNQEDQLISYIGLTNTHANLNNIEQAKSFSALAKLFLKKNPDPFLEIYVLFSEINIFDKQKNTQLSLDNLNKTLTIAQENNFEGLVVISRANLADYLFDSGRYSEANKQALLSLSDAKKLGFKSKIQQAHLSLSKIYAAKREFEKALLHSQSANQLSETLSGEKVRQLAEITRIDRQMMETEEQLKNSQQQHQILSLNLEKQKQNQVIWLTSIGIIFVIVFFLYYRVASTKEIARQQMVNLRLKELDGIKDSILKNTSHELRTPLNGIIGLSNFLLQEPENTLSQKNAELIKLIKSSGEQLARVINDILEMSKLKSRNVTIIKSHFELSELINEVVLVCSPLADKKNIQLLFQSSQMPQNILQDKTRLQQIMFNIIGNAVKFTEQGSVTIETQITGDNLQIKVIDTGIGIPRDKMARVFEGFEQLDSSDTRNNQGSGLGLAISRDLASAMGGVLKLNSEVSKGTIVTVNLPITLN